MMRKENVQFYLSVDGNTEELYFKWLKERLNSSPNAVRTVSFDIKQKKPSSYAKSLSVLTETIAYHVCDKETSSISDKEKFKRTLAEMKDIHKIRPCITYKLAYSNISFELWLLLHKTSCNSIKKTASDYFPNIKKTFSLDGVVSFNEYKEEKNFNRVLSQLSLKDVKEAIKRAEEIQRNNAAVQQETVYKGYSFFEDNPSLNIHCLIQKIFDASEGR